MHRVLRKLAGNRIEPRDDAMTRITVKGQPMTRGNSKQARLLVLMQYPKTDADYFAMRRAAFPNANAEPGGYFKLWRRTGVIKVG